MRCSKCQYIGFDNGDRCRNCGYEFSLAVDPDPLDLPIRTGDEPSGPLSDFEFEPLDAPGPAPDPPRASRRDSPAESRSAPRGELPLFRDRGRDDDAPLVSLPASPRAPVAVRKSTAARSTPRPPVQDPELDLDPIDSAAVEELAVRESKRLQLEAASDMGPDDEGVDVAPLLPRVLAGVVDLSLLAAIDAVVLYLTMKLCGLDFGDVLLLPMIPFVAFIALLNGGYVAAFTAAGGQTIGKMLTRIKVVSSDEGAGTDRVPVGASALRALGYLISALPAGIGFLPVLAGSERRGLHDRLAHTRVVKA